jgi:hypothetical protein
MAKLDKGTLLLSKNDLSFSHYYKWSSLRNTKQLTRIDNPEILANLNTKHTGEDKQNTQEIQNTKMMSNSDLTNIRGILEAHK